MARNSLPHGGGVKLAALCGTVRLVANRAQPELTEAINYYARALGMSRDAGEAGFTCSARGLAMTAYVQATISGVGNQAGAMWWADPIVSFITPSPMAGIAAGLVAYMLSSAKLDPDWVARQAGTNIAVARITAQTNAAISNTITRGWADRGAIIDRVMEEGSRARLGIDFYADPATGTQYTVSNDYRFYGADPSGRVFGAQTESQLNGLSHLDRVPP